jgi:hypothetical protein
MVDFLQYFFLIMKLIPLRGIKLLIFFDTVLHGLGIDVNDAVIDYLSIICGEVFKDVCG